MGTNVTDEPRQTYRSGYGEINQSINRFYFRQHGPKNTRQTRQTGIDRQQ